jgi:toxin FitB
MSYILDTCVLSQLRKKIPTNVKDWFESKDQDSFFISVVAIAELWDGIERLENAKKRKDLEDWFFGDVQTRFKDRILPVNDTVALKWGTMNSALKRKGFIVGVQDLYIAATAAVNNLALVTLNTKDFENLDLVLINPWD